MASVSCLSGIPGTVNKVLADYNGTDTKGFKDVIIQTKLLFGSNVDIYHYACTHAHRTKTGKQNRQKCVKPVETSKRTREEQGNRHVKSTKSPEERKNRRPLNTTVT